MANRVSAHGLGKQVPLGLPNIEGYKYQHVTERPSNLYGLANVFHPSDVTVYRLAATHPL